MTTGDNEKLLEKMLVNYVAENSRNKTMLIKKTENFLVNRYKIEIKAAGLFFINQLKAYNTESVNRNKMAVIEAKTVE